jgi:hypothetical protein
MDGLLVHGKLMLQCKMFQAQRGMRPEQRSQEGEECRDHGWHDQRPHDNELGKDGSVLLQGEDARGKNQGCSLLRVFGTDTDKLSGPACKG